ncbi:alpha/beta hydrolase [Terrimonas sp. NA20]|uniref:Alpha/beta hydrolase n=1 Tax=Terrimonas ginsenosidimutans TaxID=2908004 RepID=A0ABS9KNJ2_9BACT|nr:alpha/beta hydrolase [Terrimonas ginsenosidimutans]MCG2613876.1 alpha/beta hydrolase [Terrimonas ginsenosidimutans]
MRKTLLGVLLLILNAHYANAQAPSINDVRQAIAGEIYGFNIQGQKVESVQNIPVWTGADTIPVRVYSPSKNNALPIVFLIHGGALVAGDLNTHDNISRLLANKTGSIVIALDYRKPPEAPYPVGLNDCNTVLEWIVKNAGKFGGDAKKLTILGDSGGGLLAAALVIKNAAAIPVSNLVLINPALDLRNPGGGLYGMVTQLYLGGKPANDSLISPLVASNFSVFPPTLIVTSEKDVLKPHGDQLYEKLTQAKVTVKRVDLAGKDHLGGYWAAGHAEAEEAINETVRFILKK